MTTELSILKKGTLVRVMSNKNVVLNLSSPGKDVTWSQIKAGNIGIVIDTNSFAFDDNSARDIYCVYTQGIKVWFNRNELSLRILKEEDKNEIFR